MKATESARIAAAEETLKALYLHYTREEEKDNEEENVTLDLLTALWALESGMKVSQDPDKFGTFVVAMAAWAEAQETDSAEAIAAKGREIIDGLRKYAQAHYEQGWDVIVEGWTDEEIAQELHKHNISTDQAAWQHFSQIVDVISDVRADHTPVPGWDY